MQSIGILQRIGNHRESKMLIIGSHALKYHLYIPDRPAKDKDYIATIEEFEEYVAWGKSVGNIKKVYPASGNTMVVIHVNGEILEFSIAWPRTTSWEILYYFRDYTVAPLSLQLLLKLSHRYKKNSPHFLKTMADIKILRTHTELDEFLQYMLERREAETYAYAHPSLAQKKQGFFKESDSLYVWEHDDIHKAVAVMEAPAYTQFSKDGAEVMVSKKKWDKLDEQTKLLAGLEESYVLAIERSLVPHPGKLTRKEAFDMALEKVCTSITSGWFREYCWENYDKIQGLYSDTYYDKFLWAVENGHVRKFNV